MERDLDLIRDILLRVKADSDLNGLRYKIFEPSDFPGHTQEEIAYQVDLLFEAGLVKGMATLDAPAPAISRLTWQGHEFLASTADPGIWASVKERIKGLPQVTLAIIASLAEAELKKRFGL